MPKRFDTLSNLLSSDFAEKTAVVIPGGGPAITYADLADQVEWLAQALQRWGIKAGDCVAIALPNGLAFLATFLAVTRVRAIAAPLNSSYTADEFRAYLQVVGPRLLIVTASDGAARAAAESLSLPVWESDLDVDGRDSLVSPTADPAFSAHVDPPTSDDIALFLPTSGTTSSPKIVPLTHGNVMSSIQTIASTYKLGPNDTSLVVMPLFHIHGLLGSTLSALHTGGTVVIPPRFSAGRFWGQVLEHKVTWYSAVPTIHQILLMRANQDNAPRGVLRFIRSCSAALAPAVLRQLQDRFGAPVLEAYGMTEASHQVSSNPLPPGVSKVGSVGLPTGVEVSILDERGSNVPRGIRGEVAIRGSSVTHAYCDNPEANAAFTAGWFRTGDDGFLDEEGFLTITGRLKEIINRGGEKISPFEVDAVLLQHPAVAQALCFGVPDAKYGEEVHAAVVLRGEATESELIEFCQDRLAEFKTPRKIHIPNSLPRTTTGKTQRHLMAAQLVLG